MKILNKIAIIAMVLPCCSWSWSWSWEMVLVVGCSWCLMMAAGIDIVVVTVSVIISKQQKPIKILNASWLTLYVPSAKKRLKWEKKSSRFATIANQIYCPTISGQTNHGYKDEQLDGRTEIRANDRPQRHGWNAWMNGRYNRRAPTTSREYLL